MVPTFTRCSIDQAGTQLYPGSLAVSTPQTFDTASTPTTEKKWQRGRFHHEKGTAYCTPAHIRQIWSRFFSNGASTTDSLTLYPLVSLAEPALSGSANTSRRCQSCFPPSPAFPGSDCSQLHPTTATAER